MEKMLFASIKLFISMIFLRVRKLAKLSKEESKDRFSYSFDTDDNTRYTVTVTKKTFRLTYPYWFIPNLQRSLFKVTLNKYVGNALVDSVTDVYPEISSIRLLDVNYPQACVAAEHVNKYFGI